MNLTCTELSYLITLLTRRDQELSNDIKVHRITRGMMLTESRRQAVEEAESRAEVEASHIKLILHQLLIQREEKINAPRL